VRGWSGGVADATHEVIGTSFDPFSAKVEGNQSLIMWLQRMTTPKADFTFHQAQHSIGTVVMLEIHPARTAPVAFQNIRYIRIDSHKTKLGEHSDKEARLWEVLGQKADWSGELVAGATLDDLSQEAIEMARKRLVEYLLKSERDVERGCKNFCVNGHSAGNCHIARSDDDRRKESCTQGVAG